MNSSFGWSGHNVIYDELDPHFAGALTLCSASAEREALLWAAIWRLSQNTDIPTSWALRGGVVWNPCLDKAAYAA